MPDVLPKEFLFSHEYALFLHDILAHIVVTGAQAGVFDTEIMMESEEEAEEFEQLSQSSQVWEWIERSRQRDVIYDITYKQLMHAMLSDFCHFIYESLSASRRGKLAVAYSLLRKPLKETLLLMEWMLASPEEFLRAFYHGKPDDYAVDRLRPEKKVGIIEKALARTSLPSMFDAEFMYQARYDKRQAWDLSCTGSMPPIL